MPVCRERTGEGDREMGLYAGIPQDPGDVGAWAGEKVGAVGDGGRCTGEELGDQGPDDRGRSGDGAGERRVYSVQAGLRGGTGDVGVYGGLCGDVGDHGGDTAGSDMVVTSVVAGRLCSSSQRAWLIM